MTARKVYGLVWSLRAPSRPLEIKIADFDEPSRQFQVKSATHPNLMAAIHQNDPGRVASSRRVR
jgi:hypothetical protein